MEWISVKDSLPEKEKAERGYYDESKSVLIMTDDGMYVAEYNHAEKKWGIEWEYDFEDYVCEVTHWMPLPEPPKQSTKQ
jgi:hypothetical protein